MFSIQTNPRSDLSKPNFQSESIRMNPRSESFGLKTLFGLNRIDFVPFFIKQDTKRFSDWFRMIRIGSDTDIGMNLNSSDCLEMNSYPKLSPGTLMNISINY